MAVKSRPTFKDEEDMMESDNMESDPDSADGDGDDLMGGAVVVPLISAKILEKP